MLRLSGVLKDVEKLPMMNQNVEKYKREIEQYELNMVTTAFPSFKPLCDKGDIIKKLDGDFFSYDSEAALKRRN